MPLHFCHPEAPHKKLRMPEWYVSTRMMDRALDAVLRGLKPRKVGVGEAFDRIVHLRDGEPVTVIR